RAPAELLDFAGVCQAKKLYASAARLFQAAFVASPRLAEDLNGSHRYKAACYAALAAAGQGGDAAMLGRMERLALQRRALTWLRAELVARRKQLGNWWPGEAGRARAALDLWLKEGALASLRDKAPLARLPAEERAACERLWADVAALLK